MKHLNETKTASIAQNKTLRTEEKILIMLSKASPEVLEHATDELLADCEDGTLASMIDKTESMKERLSLLSEYLTYRMAKFEHEESLLFAKKEIICKI